jgi:predicted nucleic acid binding AN1-type Zn finger protein
MELPELGEQCSFVGCGQLDFLPFNCDGCDRTFCLEHRTSHGCRAGGKRVRVHGPRASSSSSRIPVATTPTVDHLAHHLATPP